MKTILSHFLTTGKAGDILYTHRDDKHVTAQAHYNNRKVATQRMYALDVKDADIVERIVKVTILK